MNWMNEWFVPVLTAGLGSLGYAVLFNVRGARLVPAALGGAVSWLCYLLLFHWTGESLLCYGLASFFASALSLLLARLFKSPATVFWVPSVVPMIPGGSLYYTMLYAVKGDWERFLSQSVTTLSVAAAVAVGILAGSSLHNLLILRRKHT